MKKNQNHKQTKNTFHIYAAWDYEKEAEALNQMSEQGWQLVVGGCYHQKYEFDDSVVYRYQIDFNNKIPDMARYDETFRDAGWERVSSTFNDWHIFRKVYDPNLPDEEYEIYTDEESRVEMLKRWRSIAVISAIAVGVSAINPLNSVAMGSYSPVASAALVFLYVLIALMEVTAFVSINQLINGKRNKHRFPFELFLSLLVLLLVIFLVSAFHSTGQSWWFVLGFLVGFALIAVEIVVLIVVRESKKTKK